MRLKIVYFFLAISLLGFIDATYLTVEHYRGVAPACNIIAGCGQVTSSRFATIATVPVALLGALYYLTVLILSILYIDTKKSILLFHLSIFTALGFLASVYFVILQIWVIKYICLYCMVSATTSTLLFVGGMIHLYKSRLVSKQF